MPSEVIVLSARKPRREDEKEKRFFFFFGVPLNICRRCCHFFELVSFLFGLRRKEVHRERKVHRAAFPFIDGTLRYNRYSFGILSTANRLFDCVEILVLVLVKALQVLLYCWFE